jgi:hypothetical protein
LKVIDRFQRAAVVAAAVLAAATANMVVAPQAEAALSFGAIAYAKNGAGASMWNYPSRADAEQTALDYSGYTSCEVLSSFKDRGAVVFDGSTLQGGYGPTLSSAIADAKRPSARRLCRFLGLQHLSRRP